MDPFRIQYGLETEVGIWREVEGELDVVAESIALVRSAVEPGVRMRWDYGCEDPHVDARGFRVSELRQDTDEAAYYSQDVSRPLSFSEIKSDLVLGNGARFYNDHAHPEYCTPECAGVEELVLQDRAGERILMSCAEALQRSSGTPVRLYKNNTDFLGHSYGCHENYLLPRSLPWERLVEGILPFLVTRQVFSGAGKFGWEAEDRWVGPGFQISQRADFFSELQSVDTMQRRPLINTRDEPHADPKMYRRFHVIVGDANMSPFATRLKVGTTALVLEALLLGGRLPVRALEDPVEAFRSISRDPTFRWEVGLAGGRRGSAIEIQAAYLDMVRSGCDLGTSEREGLVRDWAEVLADLARDPETCRDRVDWVAKREMIRGFQAREGIADDDPWLRSLDLEYHRLDPAEGLYYGLEACGGMRGVPDPMRVERAMREAPANTRAAVRGLCVRRFPGKVLSAQWDHVTLETKDGPWRISLLDLFRSEDIVKLCAALEAARTPDDLLPD